MLSPTSEFAGMGLDKDGALITYGRSSGATRGASIGHVSPEAASGGPIALVEEGDIIDIDMLEHSINVRLSDEELAKRKAKWQPREPKITKGYLARKTRLKYDTINRYYKSKVFVVDLDVLARLCMVLNCMPGDIIKLDKIEYKDPLM